MEDLAAGQVIGGRYRTQQKLGAGGMGAVWIAEHIELGKTVALKVMLPAVSANDQMRQRFVNEARAAAAIGHPSIVEVFDLGFHGQYAFIAMEKLEGEELERRIERVGPLPVHEAVRIAVDLSDAIGAAHELGIVHRDLKPANVFLATKGRQKDLVKVLDFGIAKLTQTSSDVNTKTGAVFGSPLFMAPEQLQDSKGVDPRTDVHAIGAILYAMLTGAPPYAAATLPELFYKIVSTQPRPLRETRPDVPEWLDHLILRALAKRPDARPANGRALAALLESEGKSSELTTTAPPLQDSGLRPLPSVEGQSAGALTPLYSTTSLRGREGARFLWAGALAVVLVLAAVVGVLATRAAGPAPRASAAEATPVATPELAAAPGAPATPSVVAPPEPVPEASAAPAPSVRPVVERPGTQPPGTAPKKPTAPTANPAAPPPLVPR